MNKSLALLSTSLLLATASPAFAASSVDLTVKGLITPNACTPALSEVLIDGNGVLELMYL
jgi:type 1 fimbria pilin